MSYVDSVEYIVSIFLAGKVLTDVQVNTLVTNERDTYHFLSAFADERIKEMDDAEFARFERMVPGGMLGRLYAEAGADDVKVRGVVWRSKKNDWLYKVPCPPL